MELLAPAGNKESLYAAVNNGADAVYFGGSLFNARRYAGNFDDTSFQEAVDYCHAHMVKTYITLNTLILDKEMNEALDYAAKISSYGADAVLVQDLGLLKLIRSQLPELPVHASTQMAIHDLEGVLAAQRLGIRRVVLARELSLDNIEYIHKNTSMELEVFVHGALCMSASGNCLFSSMIGERSGNRGTCAQPCRKRISVNGLPNDDDYNLSLSDLCMLGHIKELKSSGVCSLKIEGRMKSPAYVAAAVRAYRAALDGKDYKECADRLKSLFNRGGIHTGYFFGDDAHTDCVAESSKDAEIKYQEKKLPVEMCFSLFTGLPAALELFCGDKKVRIEGCIPQAAQKPPELDRYREQLIKLGNTPFAAQKCEIESDGFSYISIRDINELRRQACESMILEFCTKRPLLSISLPNIEKRKKSEDSIKIIAELRNADMIETAFRAGADRVAYEPWKYEKTDISLLKEYKDRLLLTLPPVIRAKEERESIRALLATGCFCGGIANHFSQIELLEALPERYAGIFCNAFNKYTVRELNDIGFTNVILSSELTKAQIRDILLIGDASVFVYGRVPLMQLRHCPVKEHNGCQGCKGEAGGLTDESGRRFPLRNISQSDGCLVRVLNCDTLDIVDLAGSVRGSDGWYLSFFEESAEQIAERISAARAAIGGEEVKQAGTTRGHWNRPLL